MRHLSQFLCVGGAIEYLSHTRSTQGRKDKNPKSRIVATPEEDNNSGAYGEQKRNGRVRNTANKSFFLRGLQERFQREMGLGEIATRIQIQRWLPFLDLVPLSVIRKSRRSVIDEEKTVDMSYCWKTSAGS